MSNFVITGAYVNSVLLICVWFQRMGYKHKRMEIDIPIEQRIHRLFRVGLILQYLKMNTGYKSVNNLLLKMLLFVTNLLDYFIDFQYLSISMIFCTMYSGLMSR